MRGYQERLVNGDEGWIANNELWTKPFVLGSLLGNDAVPDTLQLLAFLDYGNVQVAHSAGNPYPYAHASLASVGAGLRYNLARNLAARFDYGFQLIREQAVFSQSETDHGRSRAHISVTVNL